ncbi:hypothetical protein L2E82_46033 [Cichorium intybus]|uniref:Uncharacterized protein n=1 Tax=Cichorium intybus TaxID=13427 RepID=A0ACB8YT25_CICIN|nr:hypothetical protein L2E82_46033 [Cichorium intybus]
MKFLLQQKPLLSISNPSSPSFSFFLFLVSLSVSGSIAHYTCSGFAGSINLQFSLQSQKGRSFLPVFNLNHQL